MRKETIGAFVLGLLVSIGISVGGQALIAQGRANAVQAPVAPAIPPPSVEALNAQEQPTEATLRDIAEWLNVVKAAEEFAGAQCQQLGSVKRLPAMRLEYTQKVEKRLPGYTVNWQTRQIVAKAGTVLSLPAGK